MIDIVQYRARIGNFRQRNYSKGRFTFKQHAKYSKEKYNTVGQNILTACYSLLKIVLILGLISSGEHANLRLLKSNSCERIYTPAISSPTTRSVDVCQTIVSYEQWQYASSSECNHLSKSSKLRSVDVCQTIASNEQWQYASSSECNPLSSSSKLRSVDVCQTKLRCEQWQYASFSGRKKLVQLKLKEPPVMFKIPEDNNFIARYTYGNKRQH
jgi:hypothetical protein